MAKSNRKIKRIALSEIFLMIFGIVAISYALGSSVGEVSGAGPVPGRTYSFTGDPYTYRWNNGWQVIGSGSSGTYKDWTTVNPAGITELNKRIGYNPVQPPQLPSKTPTPTPISSDINFNGDNTIIGQGNNPTPSAPTPITSPSTNAINGFADGSASVTLTDGTSLTGTLKTVKGGYQIVDANGIASKTFQANEVKDIATNSIWSGVGHGFLGNIVEGFEWAGYVFIAKTILKGLFPEQQNILDPAANSVIIGILAGKATVGLAEDLGNTKFLNFATEKQFGLFTGAQWIGITVAIWYFINTYKDEKQKEVTFSCIPWQPPLGGNNCDQCNQGPYPCSEYQCRSLGQSCQLINQGTENEKCVWINRNDVNPPVIKAWNGALISNDYSYSPNSAILPPEQGVKVLYKGGCIPAFTPLKIGIQVIGGGNNNQPEPAKCKIDFTRKDSYDNMSFFMGNGLSDYNQSFALALPGNDSESIPVQNNGNYSLYVRCQDSNGNANVADFVFDYCVDQGPDTTAPLITGTGVPTGLPVAFNQTNLNMQVYVNEPLNSANGGCKWDHVDTDYNSMSNNMTSCGTSMVGDVNSLGMYTCIANLTGIKSRVENKFYFKCKDKAGNEDQDSFEYSVMGSQPLVIDSAVPNETTIKDSTNPVKVTLTAQTSAGYDQGKANCYFSDVGADAQSATYTTMFQNDGKFDQYNHAQDLWLPTGAYTYFIKCSDLGGNTDYQTINFSVESDNQAPSVVRAYHEDTYLKLITDEAATCVYGIQDCSYDIADGIQMKSTDDFSHFVDWSSTGTNLYVKCQDGFGNQPAPNQCSIILSTAS